MAVPAGFLGLVIGIGFTAAVAWGFGLAAGAGLATALAFGLGLAFGFGLPLATAGVGFDGFDGFGGLAFLGLVAVFVGLALPAALVFPLCPPEWCFGEAPGAGAARELRTRRTCS